MIIFSLVGLMYKLFPELIWCSRKGNDWFVFNSPNKSPLKVKGCNLVHIFMEVVYHGKKTKC